MKMLYLNSWKAVDGILSYLALWIKYLRLIDPA